MIYNAPFESFDVDERFDLVIADPPQRHLTPRYEVLVRSWFTRMERYAKCAAITPQFVSMHYWPQPDHIVWWWKVVRDICVVEPVLLYGDHVYEAESFETPCVAPGATAGQRPMEYAVALLRQLLPRGGRVLDAFCGSGTVAAAAQVLGPQYRVTSNDVSLDQCHVAARRTGDRICLHA